MSASRLKKTVAVPQSEDIKQFAKAAQEYRKQNTHSQDAALTALKRIGILTPSGNLSSKYK